MVELYYIYACKRETWIPRPNGQKEVFMKNRYMSTKNTKRLMALLLALLLLTVCAAGCAREITDEPSVTIGTTEPSGNTGVQAPPTELFSLIADGSAKIHVVYGNHDGEVAKNAAKSLADSLTRLGGANVYAVVDFSTDKRANSLDILFGATSYAESAKAIEELGSNSYSIKVVGNKIVVVATNPYLYSEAIKALLGALTVSNGVVTLDKSFSVSSTADDVVTLVSGKETEYEIVYSNGDEEAKTLAESLKGAFADLGVTVAVSPDTKNASGREILIGDTNRELSDEGKPYYLNAHIGVDKAGSIAVTGNLEVGVTKLIGYLSASETSDGTIDVPTSLFGIIAPEGYGNAPEYTGGGDAKLYVGWDTLRTYYVQVADAEESDYNDYIKKLEESGYQLYYETDAQECEFSIYTDGYNIINLSYVEYDSPFKEDKGALMHYVSIGIDCIDNSALPTLVAEGKKVTDVQLTMLGAACAFLIRLEDGRFIVFDGDLNNDTRELIYEQLVAQNVRSGKPTVAAWVISHTDGDHVGGFSGVLQKYSKKVELQSVIVNSPSYEKFYEETPSTAEHTTRWAKTAYDALAEYAPDAKIIVAHAGQQFAYLGLTIDVLGTYENLYNKPMSTSNHSNSVYRFTMPGGTMIFTGDARPDNCKILNAMYAEKLQADVVQYAHHGGNGGDVDFYDSVNASFGIWTNDYEEIVDANCFGNVGNNGVDPKKNTTHIIPSINDKVMILTEGMTREELSKYIRFEDR